MNSCRLFFRAFFIHFEIKPLNSTWFFEVLKMKAKNTFHPSIFTHHLTIWQTQFQQETKTTLSGITN